MQCLLISETTPKLMKLASFARTVANDHHWKAITTGAFTVQIERFDAKTMQPRIKLYHRQHLNRIVVMAAEADTVYVATEPTARGELLAADLAEQIVGRYPDRQVKRLRVNVLTERAFREAYAISGSINRRLAESMRVGRLLNHFVSSRLEMLTGRPSGRAVLPLLGLLARLERPGQARLRVRLTSGVEFETGFMPECQARRLLGLVREQVPSFTIACESTVLEPPHLYRVARLQQDGCRLLGAGSIEVAQQTQQLYESGLVARDYRVDADYVAAAKCEVEAFGDVPVAGLPPMKPAAIVPTNLRCLPSDVPKRIKPVYRLIWANTLCGFANPMNVTIERARFVIDGVSFTASSILPKSAGFDNVSLGLLYRRGHIGNSRTVAEARMFGSGPFESDLIAAMTAPFYNPALVIKSAANLNYIGFDGPEVTLLDYGRTVLSIVQENVPQLLDEQMFAATERYLETMQYPADELVGPWARWAESVHQAVKKRGVAYLR